MPWHRTHQGEGMELLLSVMVLCSTVSVAVSAADVCPIQCACSFHQIDCYGRNLQEIPRNILNTTYYVDLQENAISKIHPDRLSRLSKLDDLLLRRNKLTRLDSGTFVNLTSLKRLILSGNEIDTIQPGTFVNLPSLQVLDLSSNLISNITDLFVDVPSVERLVMSLNEITELTADSLRGLNKLQYLILSQNKITSISSDAFSEMKILSYLVLRGNPITNADRLWGGLKVLSFLDLSSCQLSAVPTGLPYTLSILRLGNNTIHTIKSTDFRALKYLGVLYLENNLITSVQQGAFSYSPHLSQIVISGNKLTQLPGTLPAQVELFIADNNKIQHIFKTNFDHDSAMKSLSLKNNSISDLAANTFGRLADLNSLYLDNNQIRTLFNMTFQGLHGLQKLSISSNPVREIQFRAFGGLAKLYYLVMANLTSADIDMQGNFLRDVPSLTTLDMHESPSLVAGILNKPDMLWTLSTVKYLNILGNNLTHLSTDLMMALPKLRWIKAIKNPWHCDANLIPLQKWMARSYRTFSNSNQMRCASPPSLKGKPILDISLTPTTTTTTTTTTATTTTTTTAKVTIPTTSLTLSSDPSSLPPKTEPYSTKGTTKIPSNNDQTTTKTSEKTGSFTSSMTTSPLKSPPPSTRTSKPATPSISSGKTPAPPSTTTKRFGSTSISPSTKRPKASTTTPSSTRPGSSKASSQTTRPAATHINVVTLPASLTTKSPEHVTTRRYGSNTPATQKSTRTNVEKSSTKVTPDSPTLTQSPQSTRSRSTQIIVTSSNPNTRSTSSSTFHDNDQTSSRSPHTSTTSSSPNSVTTTKPNGQGGFHGNQQDEKDHLPSHTSANQSNDKGMIIGLTASFLCLVVIVVVILLMVRYQRHKKKAFFVDHDISFAANKQEEVSDTVCIINYIHDQSAEEKNGISANQNGINKSQTSCHPGRKDSRETNGKTRIKTDSRNFEPDGSAEGSRPNTAVFNDDTELLMDSW